MKEIDKVVGRLCQQVTNIQGNNAQLRDEINDIEDHADQAEAEEFLRMREHDLRVTLMQLQAALTHVKGLS